MANISVAGWTEFCNFMIVWLPKYVTASWVAGAVKMMTALLKLLPYMVKPTSTQVGNEVSVDWDQVGTVNFAVLEKVFGIVAGRLGSNRGIRVPDSTDILANNIAGDLGYGGLR